MGNCCAAAEPRQRVQYYTVNGTPLGATPEEAAQRMLNMQSKNKYVASMLDQQIMQRKDNRLSTIHSSVAEDVPDDY